MKIIDAIKKLKEANRLLNVAADLMLEMPSSIFREDAPIDAAIISTTINCNRTKAAIKLLENHQAPIKS